MEGHDQVAAGRKGPPSLQAAVVTQPQLTLAVVVVAMLALLAWRRWRHDVVAVLALLAAAGTGLVPAGQVFSGFSHPAAITFPALLILAAGVRNSGLLAAPVRLLAPLLGRVGVQVAVLGGMGAVAAAFLNSHGAASAFLSVPSQVLRRAQRWPSPAVVPVRFALTLGGTATLVGTVPNILISGMRRDAAGAGYGLFAFAPVGGILALAGLAFLVFAWRLLPRSRADLAAAPSAQPEGYTSEIHVPQGSPAVGRSVAELEQQNHGAVWIIAIIREEYRRLTPRPGLVVEAEDLLVLSCGLDMLQRLIEQLRLRIASTRDGATIDPERVGVVEAVVTPSSRLVGRSCGESGLADRVSLLGVGRSEGRPLMRLHRVKLRAGDVLVLQGELAAMPAILGEFGCLLLAERRLRLGRQRQALAPALLLAGALALAAAGTAPIALALLGAVLLLVLLRNLSLNELYAGVDWSVVVLVASLAPISAAMRDTGFSAVAAERLTAFAGGVSPAAAVALTLALALASAPMVGGVATALILAPLAIALAAQLHASVDPFLMAVAVGASCDFLRQSLAPALPAADHAEREHEAWRIGLPLTVLVLVLGVPLILLSWPPGPVAPP